MLVYFSFLTTVMTKQVEVTVPSEKLMTVVSLFLFNCAREQLRIFPKMSTIALMLLDLKSPNKRFINLGLGYNQISAVFFMKYLNIHFMTVKLGGLLVFS